MTKKLIIVLLVVMMLFSLTSCKETTITFIGNDGEVKDEIELSWFERIFKKGITLPEAEEITGYRFMGWYLEPGNSDTKLDEQYFANNRVSGDLIAYACYIDARYEAWPLGKTGTAEITGVDSSVINAEIPEKVTISYGGTTLDYTVVQIGASAFANNSNIVSVVVPDTVVTIKDNAFSNCENLKTITIPATVSNEKDKNTNSYKNIGNNIFEGTALEKVEAPTWIFDICLSDNARRGLVEVVFNAGNTVSAGMFKDATLLESVTLSSTINFINAEAFWNASSLKSITIPASVDVIADSAFAYCSSLKSITVEQGNQSYESNGSDCIVLKELIHGETDKYTKTLIAGCSNTTIYSGINKIARCAFNGCTGLAELNIPTSVTDIAEGAFDYCTSLKSINADGNKKYRVEGNCLIYDVVNDGVKEPRLVQGCMSSVIPEGIVTISANAFKGCKGLQSITVPSTVAVLEEGTFENCVSLETVVINNPDIVFNGDAFSFSTCEEDRTDCPSETCECEGDACRCKIKFKNVTVPEHLLDYFIDKAKSVLTDVTVTAGESIDNNCFEGCSSLISVTLPDELTRIGNYAFSNCVKLEKVIISDNSALESIGSHSFDGCASFKQIGVPSDAVAADNAPTVFTVPATVTTIGDYAFKGCAIESLSFEDTGVKRIGYKVFADCKSLVCVTISSDVEDVDFDAFNGCANLKEAHLPSDFVRALSNAKDNSDHTHCEKDKAGNWICQNHYPSIEVLDITYGDILDSYYIKDMKFLKTLKIGASVTLVDNRAFEGCSNLETIIVDEENSVYYSEGNCLIEKATGTLVLGSVNSVIPEEVKMIASYAFAQSAVSSITIPATVEKVERYAFSSCRSLETVVIESGSTVIADKAFDGCDKVKKVSIPASAISHISQVSLEDIEITEGDIPAGAFKNCITLKKVTISGNVSSIGEDALEGCDNIIAITASASILLGFTELPIEHLGITDVDIDGKIDMVFMAKFPSINSLYLGNFDRSKIANGAFADCDNIVTLDVPAWALSIIPTANVTDLTVHSGSMESLSNITLPSLVNLTFGKDVTDIKSEIFAHSSNLNNIAVESGSAYIVEGGRFLLDGGTLVLGALGSEAEKTTLPSKVTAIGDHAFAGRVEIGEVELHDGVVSIGNYAFYGCTGLVLNSFPSTVESVGDYAFYNCMNITSLKLEGVTSVGKYAFFGCTSATEIVLPSVEEIGTGAFIECNGIESASVPVLAIGYLPKTLVTLEIVGGEELTEDSVKGFEYLTTVIIGSTVKKISSSAISVDENKITSVIVSEENEYYRSEGNCVIGQYEVEGEYYNLGYLVIGCNTSVIPEGVTVIKENAFRNCIALTSVTIPASVTSIEPLAFKGCTSIEGIDVADGNETYYSKDNCVITTETVGDDDTVVLVWGCKASVIPSEVTKIGDYAFAYSGITTVKLPVTVKEIGDYAFAGSESLVGFYVYMLGEGESHSLEKIGDKAFENCIKLEKVILPGTVTEIAADSFNGVYDMTVFWYGTEEEWDNAGYSFEYLIYDSEYTLGCWYYIEEADGSVPVIPEVW